MDIVEVEFNGTWFAAMLDRAVPAGSRYRSLDGSTTVLSTTELEVRLRNLGAAGGERG